MFLIKKLLKIFLRYAYLLTYKLLTYADVC